MAPEETESLLAASHVGPFEMRGKGDGRLGSGVEAEGVTTKRELERWVQRGVALCPRWSLPPKKK